MDGTNPSQWLPGSRWGSSAANHRYQHHASEHDRTDSHADCALDIIDGNLAAISICPEVPVTAVKMQTRCNVSCQLAEGRRQNHTPSITFHQGPGGSAEETPWHGKRKPVRKSPGRVGTPVGEGGEGGQKQKRRVHLRRGTNDDGLTCQKRTSRPFFSLRPLPAVIVVPYFPLSNSLVWWRVMPFPFPISHFHIPSPISLQNQQVSA